MVERAGALGCFPGRMVLAVRLGLALAVLAVVSLACSGGGEAEGDSDVAVSGNSSGPCGQLCSDGFWMVEPGRGVREVQARIEAGDTVDGPLEPGGLTPLHYAAAWADAAVVRLLLDEGADVNAGTGGGVVPLHVAVGQDEEGYDVTLTLLDAGADVNAQQRGLGTPLFMAAYADGDQVRLVRLMLEYNPDLGLGNEVVGTPLHGAAFIGNVGVGRLLIEAGADVEARSTEQGYTPLHYAVRHFDFVSLLLESGANMDARLNSGSQATPCDSARTEAKFDDGPDVDRSVEVLCGLVPFVPPSGKSSPGMSPLVSLTHPLGAEASIPARWRLQEDTGKCKRYISRNRTVTGSLCAEYLDERLAESDDPLGGYARRHLEIWPETPF